MRKACLTKYLRIVLFTLLIAVAGGSMAGQNTFYAPTGEVNIFGGVSRFFVYPEKAHDPFRLNLADGALVGARGTWNFANYFGLEGSYSYGWENLRFRPSAGAPPPPYGFVGFGSNTQIVSMGPVIYLTPPHRVRLFAKVAVAEFIFQPTGDAHNQADSLRYAFLNLRGLDTDNKTGALYGIGVKGYFTRTFGFRADFEGSTFPQPHMRIPTYPANPGATFVPSGGLGTQYQLTAGIFFGFGGRPPAPPPPPQAVVPPPPPPPKPEPELAVNAPAVRTVNAGCPGDTTDVIPLTVTARTNLEGHRPLYRWTVNGQPTGGNTATFAYAVPPTAGQYRVGVTVADDAAQSNDPRTASSASSDLLVVNVREYHPPTISGSASPAEIPSGSQTRLTVTPQGDECNRQMAYTCMTDQGRLTGNPANTFDSTGVAFDLADRSRAQSHLVNISCTVRDAKGGMASTIIPVTVTLAPLTPQRLDDIIFSANNSRVNNCGKRILVEELYPQLTQHPDWDVILVGHRGPDDRNAALDRQRVLNAAASVSAGTDSCPLLEPSRIRMSLEGTDQKSDPRPGFCGTSARTASTERSGQTVSGDDANAKLRRVEVYLIPKGAAVPEAAAHAEAVPAAALKVLGCPR